MRIRRITPDADLSATASSATRPEFLTSLYSVRGFEGRMMYGCQYPASASPASRREKRATSMRSPVARPICRMTSLEPSRSSCGALAHALSASAARIVMVLISLSSGFSGASLALDRFARRVRLLRRTPQRAVQFGSEARQSVEQRVAVQAVKHALPLPFRRHQAGLQ